MSQLQNFLSLEYRLVFRNNRTRKILLSALLSSLAILLFVFSWENSRIEHLAYGQLTVFVLITVFSGTFFFGYGQYNFSWNSGHFSLLLTLDTNWKEFYFAKLIFLVLISLILLLPVWLFLLFTGRTVYLFYCSCAYLFNAGILGPTSCIISLYNDRRLDFTASGVFGNYQGMGRTQHLAGIPYGIFIAVILAIGLLSNHFVLSWYLAAAVGLLLLAASFLGISYIARRLGSRKYQLLAGFDQK